MKIATIEDIKEIADMSMKFMATTGYSDFSDREHIEAFIEAMVTGPQNERIILIEPGIGFIAGMSSVHPFGPTRLATEVAWWVEPEARETGAGKMLLEAFEFWAKEKAGCQLISMVGLDESLDKFYTKNGYKLYERAYMKVL